MSLDGKGVPYSLKKIILLLVQQIYRILEQLRMEALILPNNNGEKIHTHSEKEYDQ